MDITLERLRAALHGPDLAAGALPVATEPRRWAVVAMVLRQRAEVEVLLIERAHRAGDPWSGQVALPGGRIAPGDQDLVETAVRETHEEVGLQLERSAWFGNLEDLEGHRRLPQEMVISARVFEAPPDAETGALEASEVHCAFWVPLCHLINRGAAVRYRFGTEGIRFPGVLLPDGRNVLWGLTYRFLAELLHQVNLEVAGPTPDSPLLIHHSAQR